MLNQARPGWALRPRVMLLNVVGRSSMRAVYALVILVLAVPAPTQMVDAGAVAHPGKPLPPGLKAPRVDFRDVARQAGLTAVNVSGEDKQKSYIVEDTGNGVALIDFDNDGLLDILFVTGDRLQS